MNFLHSTSLYVFVLMFSTLAGCVEYTAPLCNGKKPLDMAPLIGEYFGGVAVKFENGKAKERIPGFEPDDKLEIKGNSKGILSVKTERSNFEFHACYIGGQVWLESIHSEGKGANGFSLVAVRPNGFDLMLARFDRELLQKEEIPFSEDLGTDRFITVNNHGIPAEKLLRALDTKNNYSIIRYFKK